MLHLISNGGASSFTVFNQSVKCFDIWIGTCLGNSKGFGHRFGPCSWSALTVRARLAVTHTHTQDIWL